MKKSLLSLLLLCGNAHAAHALELTAADRRDLNTIAEAMGQVRTLRADFEQTAPDGSQTAGVFTMRRPGKARFEYTAPSSTRVVTDGFWVSVEDTRTKTQDRFPLNGAPLALLLAEKPSFSSDKVLIEHVEHTAEGLDVTVRDSAAPEQGALTMRFALQPVHLLGWSVLDAQGQVTEVKTRNLRTGIPTDNRLFFIEDLRKNSSDS